MTERTELNPTTERAIRRVDAEEAARAYGITHGVSIRILRVPSIYGPGRLPIERLERRDPLPPAAQCGYTSRIHVTDLVTAIMALCNTVDVNRVYNISDGVPLTTRAWRELVADVAGLSYPPEVSWEEAEQQLSAKTLSFMRESRRIDSRLIRRELGLSLAFDDPVDGIRDALGIENGELT